MIKITLPPTSKRVSDHTNPKINLKIRNRTIENLSGLEDADDAAIANRIKELSHEWDIERLLETKAASIVILSTFLGLKANKYWFLLAGAAGIFMLQHALQGWCPPLPAARYMGVRTAEEINKEKTALKMMRGDFSKDYQDAEEMFDLVEKE